MSTEFKIENIKIKRVNPLELKDEDWAAYHEFRAKFHEEVSPDDPRSSNESSEKTLKAQVKHPEFDLNMFFIHDATVNKQIGFFFYGAFKKESASYEANQHLVQYDYRILNAYPVIQIGTLVLEIIHKFASENDKKVLIAGTDESKMREFYEVIGAKEALAGAENRLKVAEIDEGMITKWNSEGMERNSDSEMKFIYTIPEEIIEEYSKVYTETMNQQPLDDLDVNAIVTAPESIRQKEQMLEQMGRKLLTAITFEKDGRISGLTELMYNPARETMISQILTGVKSEYRGRGLGKWLKAAMILKMKEEFPKVEIISTDNATSNAPMLAINNRLGFKIHKETVNTQITTEGLGKYLKQA